MIADYFKEGAGFGIDRPQGFPEWKWLLFYTVGGNGTIYSEDGDVRTCGAGELVLLRSDLRHGYHTGADGRWNFLWVHFNDIPQTSYFPDNRLSILPVTLGYRRKQIYRAFRNIVYHFRDRSPLWRELCEAIAGELLIMLAELQNKRLDPRIDQVQHILALRMKESLRVEQLAEAIGLSVSRLSHLFKQQTGKTIVETLIAMRMRQAALLLEHAGRNASEAAYEVGYRDYNNFLIHFRKHFQMTPREFLSRHRPNP